MRSNKLIDLIKALSKSEKHKLSQQFKQQHHEKSKYTELFEILSSSDISILNKETIFTKLYDVPYTEDKDYLLRNVYRNLTRKIEDFLIEESFHDVIKDNLNVHNYFLLKSFEHLRLYNLFDKNFKGSVNHALADGDYLMASSMTSLQVNNYIHHVTPKTKNFEEANHLLSLQMAYLSSFYLNSRYKSEIKQKQVTNAIGIEKAIEEEPLDYINDNEKYYESYLRLKYDIFNRAVEDNIKHLETCLSLLEKLPDTFKDVIKERQFCSLSLAHEYVLEEQYDKANAIYEVFLDEDVIEDSLRSTLVFDFISNLMRQENYALALEKVQYFETKIENSTPALQLKLRFLKLMLFAFLKEGALLHEHVPLCNNLVDYEKYICRFLYSIVAYLRQDFADAYRECLNLKNSLRYKGPKFDVRDILGFYLRFYNLHKNNVDNKEHLLKGIGRLHNDMALYSKHALPEFKEYLPFLWLKREVNLKLELL